MIEAIFICVSGLLVVVAISLAERYRSVESERQRTLDLLWDSRKKCDVLAADVARLRKQIGWTAFGNEE